MNSYYTDTLYPIQNKVLTLIDGLKTPFYLTGDTALSRCYFHHRYSDDLDFFVNKEKGFRTWSEKIITELIIHFDTQVTIKSESYVSIMIDGMLKVDFVNDVQYKFGGFEKKDIFSKVDVVENILSNKISAVVSRDEPKDVVDIWIIATNSTIDWKSIFIAANSKAVGIFPPDAAQRIEEFPIELLSKIKWVDEKKPTPEKFKNDLYAICSEFLKA